MAKMDDSSEVVDIPEPTDIDKVVEMTRGLLERYPQAAPHLIQLFNTIESKLQAITEQALSDVQASLTPPAPPGE
jgi:hypothetical protein